MMEAINTAPIWLVILCAILGGAVLGHLTALMRPEKIVGIVPQVDTVRIEEGDSLILTYPELFNKEQRAALTKMVEDRFPEAKGRILILEGGIGIRMVKAAKAQGADFVDVAPNFPTNEQLKRAYRVDKDTVRMLVEDLTDNQRTLLYIEGKISAEQMGIKRVPGKVKPVKTGSFYDPFNAGEPARLLMLDRLQSGAMTPTDIQEALADGRISINDVRESQARRRDDNRSHQEPSEPWN